VVSQKNKKLTLSIGKLLGIIAILLLLVGPFQPYWVTEDRTTGSIGASSLTDNWYDNSESIVPFITMILILILLFPQMPFYFEKDSKFGKINHIFLMLWGASFFLSYLSAAINFIGATSEWTTYPGYGHWMIVLGFFLCGLAGFLAWGGYPAMNIPLAAEDMKEEGKIEADTGSKTESVIQIKPKEVDGESINKDMPPKIEAEKEPVPLIVPQTSEPQKIEAKEPTSEEEKTLRRWARHIDTYNQTYEQCIKCRNYVFMRAKDTGDAIIFSCPDCSEIYKLKK
jgi:hypothetical protein